MLISPGATPQVDLYLFVEFLALVEVAVFVGRIVEKPKGDGDSQSMLSKMVLPQLSL